MDANDKIREEDLRRKMDLRVQPRNLKAEMYLPTDLESYVDLAADASEQAVVCSEAQPALGLYNEADLLRVQQTFQRYTSK